MSSVEPTISELSGSETDSLENHLHSRYILAGRRALERIFSHRLRYKVERDLLDIPIRENTATSPRYSTGTAIKPSYLEPQNLAGDKVKHFAAGLGLRAK